MPAAPTLSLRGLNRATLARQMLLTRERSTVLGVVERLVALQAQWPMPPFVGVWTRMQGFEREQLLRLVQTRKAVRATSLRGTLHLMSAKDFAAVRPALQPALELGAQAMLRDRARGVDAAAIAAEGRAIFAKGPRTFESLRDSFAALHPKGDIRALAYMVRMRVPLVLVPTEDPWGFPATAEFALAESWLGKPLAKRAGVEALALRYLAAFGPATAGDMQKWSGLPPASVREAFAALAPKLTALRGERGRELLDVPKAPRPPEDTVAPVRFLPEFDNLLLAHVNRRRIVADAHRRFVFLPGLRVAPTFLVDGFVAGTWRTERKKDAAVLAIEPFGTLAKGVRGALEKEAMALLRFIEEDAARFDVRVEKRRG